MSKIRIFDSRKNKIIEVDKLNKTDSDKLNGTRVIGGVT